MSNDEEARALRQVQAGKPNKCWRVLHRVTYVERPALMGFGRDLRTTNSEDQAADAAVSYFDSLERKNKYIQQDIKLLMSQISRLEQKIDELNNE